MKRTIRFLLYPILFSLGFVANATTVIPPSFDDLVRRAQIIFEGEVTGLHSQWIGEGAEHRIVTYVTFKVDDALKGDPGANYSIRMLGGTVDGRTMEVTDAPKFRVGDHDLLFVENNGSQFIPLVGIMHGRFRIEKDQTGRETLLTGEGQPLSDVNQCESRKAKPKLEPGAPNDNRPTPARNRKRLRNPRIALLKAHPALDRGFEIIKGESGFVAS